MTARLLTSAHLAMCRVPRAVSVEARLAVLTVSSFGIVSTPETHGTALTSRQSVQFHVEATPTRV